MYAAPQFKCLTEDTVSTQTVYSRKYGNLLWHLSTALVGCFRV